jgi:hypothetical protein
LYDFWFYRLYGGGHYVWNRQMINKETVTIVIEAMEALGKANFDWMGTDTFDSMVEQVVAKVRESEPKTVFVVIKGTGEFDDYRERNVFTTYDRQKADDYIARKQSAFRLRTERYEAVHQHWLNWQKENIEPDRPILVPRPSWGSGRRAEEITEEMRAERARIEALNDTINQDYHDLHTAYYDRHEVDKKEFIRTKLGVTDEKLVEEIARYEYRTEPRWKIQELEITE